MYIWKSKHKTVILTLYIDDILIFGNCKNKIVEVKAGLQGVFNITDLGKPETYLGIQIERNNETRT